MKGKVLNWRNIMRRAAELAVGSVQAGEPDEDAESVLFAPGDGQPPLHIAGRSEEIRTLRGMLAKLTKQHSPAHNAALHAPRGMGKSVLLDVLRREALMSGKVKAVMKTASSIQTLPELFRVTLGKKAAMSKRTTRALSAHAGGETASIGGEWSTTLENAQMIASEWEDAMVRACRRKPMLLLIDEAHTLDLAVAHVLLNGSQQLRRQAPFALVIAGTPGLEAYVAKAQTTFWERLASGDMQLGLLSQDEAQDALRRPLQDDDMGLPFDEDAITEMAKRSDGYPYFVQLWGEQAELHSRRHGEARITLETMQAIEPAVRRMRDVLYRKRWDEMCRHDIREAVENVAPVLTKPDAIITDDAAKALMGAQKRLDDAVRLGVLQKGQDAGTVQAGIPSLMQYVMESQARLEQLTAQERTSLGSANNQFGQRKQ